MVLHHQQPANNLRFQGYQIKLETDEGIYDRFICGLATSKVEIVKQENNDTVLEDSLKSRMEDRTCAAGRYSNGSGND